MDEELKLTRKDMKEEALVRMKMLNLHPNVIKEFEDKDKLNLSQNGFLYWVEEPEILKAIHEFEEEYDCLVYHVIENYFVFGHCYTMLYVSKNSEEWEMDIEDLKAGFPYAYVYNVDAPELSEIGGVQIYPRYGGVLRIA